MPLPVPLREAGGQEKATLPAANQPSQWRLAFRMPPLGMYLPFETTFAIFVGGVIRWIADRVVVRRGYNEGQRARVENAGVLTASGLVAGEAILGLVWAGLQFTPTNVREHLQLFAHPSYLAGLGVLVLLAVIMIRGPLKSAGNPDEPAPPVAMM